MILIAVALVMSVVMAYLPISYESINRPEENGGYTELDGLAAIQFKRDYYEREAGEVTPRLMRLISKRNFCFKEREGFSLEA